MAITASRITVSLGGKPILHDVDAQIRPGEVLGLIGPNGAGKTTLLRVLAALLTPDCGGVDYDGASARALGRAALARRIAFLAQGGEAQGALSVEALVGLGRLPHRRPFAEAGEVDRQAVTRALALCDVTGFAARAVGTLSGGERRRVLLARALAVEASYLLADEPLAGLDPQHQLDTLQLLRRISREGTGVVVVLHDLTLAGRFCDRLLLLDHGRRVADGAPADVLDDDRLAQVFGIHALRSSQAGESFLLPWRTLNNENAP
ncbi:ABC transporter ATP-binding protein [Bosea robiniae]|uniref:Iron complex transport system ATP-binding protein n=1 Tax=Bosea robiniae TaxID=1036780 RepID=A0ABY0PBP8_9HYPH|nr:ABC transporter ATP-binding protein [Bosea robiniae]SDH62738.1 iron complex transport system ATP-binding protein [Bosea robiniae]